MTTVGTAREHGERSVSRDTVEVGAHPEPGGGSVPPLLIVNADDFGMTPGICDGILRAHAAGLVTSTSALTVAPAFDDRAESLRDSGLPVGAHLAAVGADPPLLSAREIPSLVDRTGHFPETWQQFLRRAGAGRVDGHDLRREFDAQVEKLRGAGIEPSHLDSHQNLHLWPQMAAVVTDLARDSRIGAIRVPRSAGWGPDAVGVRVLSAFLARRTASLGLRFPQASLGLDEVPGPHRRGVVTALDRLRATGRPTSELVVHLARDPDPQRIRHASRFRWAEQLDAVCDLAVVDSDAVGGFRLGSFRDLAADDVSLRPAG